MVSGDFYDPFTPFWSERFNLRFQQNLSSIVAYLDARILTSVFHDDYPCFELSPLASHTTKFLDGFFDVLGWKHAVTGKKTLDFDQKMQALGVQYNLENIWNDEIKG